MYFFYVWLSTILLKREFFLKEIYFYFYATLFSLLSSYSLQWLAINREKIRLSFHFQEKIEETPVEPGVVPNQA